MFVKNEMSTHPITITSDRPIYEAKQIMKENGVRHLPVVTPKGELVGLITRTTLNEALPSTLTTLSVWEINYELNKIKVHEAMLRRVHTTTEDVPIEKAARIMLEQRIGSLPVLRGKKLVGIITDIDLMRIMMELLGAREPGVRITMLMPDEEGQLSKVVKVIADKSGYIGALGTYPADDPLKWWLVTKVRHVEKDDIVAALDALDEIEVIDARED